MSSNRGQRAASRSRYRGPDRRRVQPGELPWAIPAAAVAIFVPVIMVATTPSNLPVEDLKAVLSGAGMVGGLALAVLGTVTWRATGRAAPLWLTAGAIAYTLWMAELAQLREMLPGNNPSLWLSPAAVVGLWLALGGAALWPTVDARLRPWMMLVGGGAGVLALALVLHFGFGVAVSMTEGPGRASQSLFAPLPTLLPAGWIAVAVVLAVQGYRRRDPVLGWAMLLALAIGGAEALRYVAGAPQVLLASELAHAGAVVAVTGGLGASMVRLTSGHRREVGEAIEESEMVKERLRAADAARSELRHEAQNALTTVDAGVSTLHASHGQLSAEERAALSEAVRGTVERLRLLLNDADDDQPLRPVRVTEVLGPVVAGARARGQTVRANIPSDVWVLARGPALAQTLDILLDNAAKYAAASTVELRATVRREGVVLHCEDDGPGVPASERERIFQRGHRGQAAQGKGKGLGLSVAARLVHDQGGAIWVGERDGGGASFSVWLARAQPEEARLPASVKNAIASEGTGGTR